MRFFAILLIDLCRVNSHFNKNKMVEGKKEIDVIQAESGVLLGKVANFE